MPVASRRRDFLYKHPRASQRAPIRSPLSHKIFRTNGSAISPKTEFSFHKQVLGQGSRGRAARNFAGNHDRRPPGTTSTTIKVKVPGCKLPTQLQGEHTRTSALKRKKAKQANRPIPR